MLAPIVDAAGILGATRILVNGFDPEFSRFTSRVGRYAEEANARDIGLAVESMPYSSIRTLRGALDVIRDLQYDNVGVEARLSAP
jgi:sugar phosphate isomerase/epimerase